MTPALETIFVFGVAWVIIRGLLGTIAITTGDERK